MDIVINGARSNGEFTSIDALLEERDLDPAKVVVEVNGVILDKNDFAELRLKEGDSVEIVQFVGGG